VNKNYEIKQVRSIIEVKLSQTKYDKPKLKPNKIIFDLNIVVHDISLMQS